jgi:sugar lactone lactonase YvrE
VYIDDDQTIYVADSANHRIVEWKSDAINGQIVASENDSLIICDRDNRRVVRWPRRNGHSGVTLISNIDCRDLKS